jgi:hypothetical protein
VVGVIVKDELERIWKGMTLAHYLLTPWSIVLLEKLTVNFAAFTAA